MVDLDMLLTVVGVILAAIGVLALLLGKSRTGVGEARRNVFEAFGIKLDVANPSVLLIMFGVVLMLAPRVLPLPTPPQPDVRPPDHAVEPAPDVAPGPPVEPPAQVTQVSVPPDPAPEKDGQPESTPDKDAQAEQAAAAQAELAAARERELAELRAQREAAVRERAALAEQQARLAALRRQAEAPPAVQVTRAPEQAAEPLPRLVILTEALNYEGETDGSLRAKLHRELTGVVRDELGTAVELDSQNPGFRKVLRLEDMSALCKRTRADHLLLADLTPVVVESFTVESANWPNMRYSAVACDSGRVARSSEMRMEPTVGDRYPLQQSVEHSARAFVRDQHHLLQ